MQEPSIIDRLIKQFEQIKLLLAEAVLKGNKLAQSKNNCKNSKKSLILFRIVTNSVY